MTLPAIVNTARTLSYYSLLQNVTANNLANVSSDGYKGDRMAAHAFPGNSHPTAVHGIDFKQGDLRDTQRPLDVALQGAGFLVVKTPEGERLTRGGSMEVNPTTGVLMDRHGNPVLGVDGPITVGNARVVISPDGTVVAGGSKVGQLRIETVADPRTLTKQGLGLFVSTTPTIAATDVGVHQGAVEDSNVNPVLGSMDLLAIQRAYTASVEALRTMDGVMGTVTGDIGRVVP